MLRLVRCLYYLYQWSTVKKISDNEIYFFIKYIKSVLWRVAKRLSYIEDARCLKVNYREWANFTSIISWNVQSSFTIHKYTYCTALQTGNTSQYCRNNVNIVTETQLIHMTTGLFAIIVHIRTYIFYFLLVNMMKIKLGIFKYWTTVITLVFVRSPRRSQSSSCLLKIIIDWRIEKQIITWRRQ